MMKAKLGKVLVNDHFSFRRCWFRRGVVKTRKKGGIINLGGGDKEGGGGSDNNNNNYYYYKW